tara:strand:- start:174 stop:1820 length:1647 start_codon:yes stop_codon:yes gene_type:complete
MSTLTLFLGELGTRGIDGETGLGVADIRESIIENPLLSVLKTNKLNNVGDVTVSRTGEALIKDRYGDYQFITGDDHTNYLYYSNDFANWSDALNNWTLTSTNNADPDGGNDASYITLNTDITPSTSFVIESTASGMTAGYKTASFWFKVVSGTVTDLEFKVGSESFRVKSSLNSTWERVTVSTEVNVASSLINIKPIGLTGAVIGLYNCQFENGSNVTAYIDVPATTPVTVVNTVPPIRRNNLGYLIEETKTNIIQNTENLTRTNWGISGGTVSSYNGQGVFRDWYQYIQMTFTNQSLLLSSTGTFTPNVDYTVSFFVYVLSGSVTALNISLQGGATVNLIQLPTEGFVRLNAVVRAGASGDLVFNFISPDLTGNLLFMGVQVETGGLTSYIRSATGSVTRPEDDANGTYTLPRPDAPWSFAFTHNSVIDNSSIKFVFDNGQAPLNDFAAWFSGTQLNIKIGSVTSTFNNALDSTRLGAVYDGTNIKLYKDGFLYDTQSNNGFVSLIAPTVYIGSDDTSTNSINAYLSNMEFWQDELTAAEMRTITGI